MFLAPVLTVIRASGFGSSFGVATLLIGSCAVLPNESDTLRIKRVEEAVLPTASVALEAEQTKTAKRLYLRLLEVERENDEREERHFRGSGPGADVRRIDRSELRPYAIKVGGKFYVRIGAFDIRSDARAVASELGRVTSELVDVVEFGMGDGRNAVRLYRVLAGPIASQARLIELVATLEGMGYGAERVPAPVASESERAAEPDPAPSTGQRTAGPELVEVFPEPVGDEATASTQGTQPAPETQEAVAMSGADAQRSGADSEEADPAASDPGTNPAFVVHRGSERFLQIGAYAARSTANALVAELRGQIDGQLRITEVLRGGGEPIYRVRIGPIASDESLLELVNAVESLGYFVE